MSKPRIVFFNRLFESWPDIDGWESSGADFRLGPEHLSDADAVVFHLPTLGSLPDRSKPAGQLWIGWSMESRATCPLLDDPRCKERVDLWMTYERDADIWCPYFGPGTVPGMLRPPRPKTGEAAVVHLQSNPYDNSGRNRYAFELMRRIKVDSYGSVLRNRKEVIPPGWEQRTAVMERYKFTLAFENSFSRDYVSDKFFDVLCAGSVPVYRGAAEVGELAPGENCYIDARDFAGPAELAAHLTALAGDPAAYARHHAWRAQGLSPRFEEYVEGLRGPWTTRLAQAVLARL